VLLTTEILIPEKRNSASRETNTWAKYEDK
jgi:hypothetical protein